MKSPVIPFHLMPKRLVLLSLFFNLTIFLIPFAISAQTNKDEKIIGDLRYEDTSSIQEVVPNVYFHEGQPQKGYCNNGWVVFKNFVLVIDANYPSGAKVIKPLIKETTDKPIRFVFDTHHHPDHCYGNAIWADTGATIVATTRALEEMKKAETGYYGSVPGGWEAKAKQRDDVAATHFYPPTLVFPDELIFDDGKQRIELYWFGPGHTPGDGYVWLPKQKILFTGDACVNGPRNKVEDGNISDWINTLEIVKKLGTKIVCPGHGPMGGPEIIADQQAYFIELQKQVKALVDAGKTTAEIKAAVPTIATELKNIPNIARYVQSDETRHVQKVYLELGGEQFSK